MSITIKNVGKERIHVKETFVASILVKAITGIFTILTFVYMFYYFSLPPKLQQTTEVTFIGVTLALVALYFLLSLYRSEKWWGTKPAYYVDTSMYGIGGITIPKTNSREDRIAICKATREFEAEMLQHMENDNNLKNLVGSCD